MTQIGTIEEKASSTSPQNELSLTVGHKEDPSLQILKHSQACFCPKRSIFSYLSTKSFNTFKVSICAFTLAQKQLGSQCTVIHLVSQSCCLKFWQLPSVLIEAYESSSRAAPHTVVHTGGFQIIDQCG